MSESAAIRSLFCRGAILCALMTAALAVQASETTQPPRSPGSNKVKVTPGQSDEENKRMLGAHEHHSAFHYKKDYTHDDSLDDMQDTVAPRRPNGSARVVIQPGQSPLENQRMQRAHQDLWRSLK